MNLISERDAAIELLNDAQSKINIVQPASIRPPLLMILRAAVELCQAHQSILGLPLNHTLDLAKQIVADRGAGR